MKEARITWSNHHNEWVIRYYSESDQEWNFDSSYKIFNFVDDQGRLEEYLSIIVGGSHYEE